ncbi:hypothetical protein BKA62DRAFT_688779 [Auriculariales sp. MPI-PUGE-AT-0066]|nr:hypothetical protein BKA62DRAFT_688779 [Auriculariales sp. MPI-PUGE-AT-0066]
MENPLIEIDDVVRACVGLDATPDSQVVAIERYFTRDAAFNHPLCKVGAAPGSREAILKIYQWYRILSPKLLITVNDRTWVEQSTEAFMDAQPSSPTLPVAMVQRGTMFLDITQTFHLFFSPFSPRPAHLVTKLTLVKEGGALWFIDKQEDFYQPEDICNLIIPPLASPTLLIKGFASLASNDDADEDRKLREYTISRAMSSNKF